MSGYTEALLGLIAINIVAAYAAYLPLTTGQLNLGLAGFMAIGAYTSGLVGNALAFSPFLSVPIATFAAGIVGSLLAIAISRTSGIYLVLATIAFGELIRSAILNFDLVGAAAGYPINTYIGLPFAATAAVLVCGCTTWFMSTRAGLAVEAVHLDPLVAEQFGVRTRAVRVVTFAVGAALAGLAGALYAHHYSYVEAQRFHVGLSVLISIYVLVGGTRSPLGPLVGAVFFVTIPEVLRIGESWRYVIFGAAIVLVMIWRPNGLVDPSMVDFLRDRFTRQKTRTGVP